LTLPPISTLFPYTTLFRSYGRSACANWRRWPRESALNQNFVIQQFGGFYSLPPARFIAQLSMKEERFPDALQPADSPLSSPDASDRKSTRLNSSHVAISYA